MTNTTAMPELPEPRTLSRGDEDGRIQLGYTADQMRAYALATLQAQPAEVSDGDIVAALEAAGVKFQRFMGGITGTKDCWSTAGSQDVRKLLAGIRAILALRTQSESEQEKELRRSLAEAQATISERNAEIIELQKRIRRSPQAVVAKAQVSMTDEQRALIIGRAADKTVDRSAAALYAICETERLYGITAPAGGEGKA